MTVMSRPHDTAIRLIEAQSAQVTPVRVQVLALLLAHEGAHTHHDLMAAASAHQQPLDKVTLYRTLDWLVDKGLAHVITGRDRIRRYSASRHAHTHAHFECERCHRLYCLPEPVVSPEVPAGFTTRSVEVTLVGVCAGCAAAG